MKKPKVPKVLALFLCFLLVFQQSGFAQVATELNLSGYLARTGSALTPATFRPAHLRYLAYDTANNNFNLLLDEGDTKGAAQADPAKELLNYFFVGMVIPDDSFWVNLRPDSPDNVIDDYLAQTEVGRILLEADVQLKKDTAMATSPQTPEGKKYWDSLYRKAGELLGQEHVTIPTLIRPWIVPGEIIIRESEDNAYIYKATLKVCLEDDYLKGSATYSFSDPRLKQLNEYSSQLLKELILPALTRQINTSQRYARLRQVYYSLILAQWFKSKFYGKGGLYSALIDKRDLSGLTSAETWSKDTYFKQYQKSFRDGEYNLQETVSGSYGNNLRTYFSGGLDLRMHIAPAAGTPVPGHGTGAGSASSPIQIISGSRDIARIIVNVIKSPGQWFAQVTGGTAENPFDVAVRQSTVPVYARATAPRSVRAGAVPGPSGNASRRAFFGALGAAALTATGLRGQTIPAPASVSQSTLDKIEKMVISALQGSVSDKETLRTMDPDELIRAARSGNNLRALFALGDLARFDNTAAFSEIRRQAESGNASAVSTIAMQAESGHLASQELLHTLDAAAFLPAASRGDFRSLSAINTMATAGRNESALNIRRTLDASALVRKLDEDRDNFMNIIGALRDLVVGGNTAAFDLVAREAEGGSHYALSALDYFGRTGYSPAKVKRANLDPSALIKQAASKSPGMALSDLGDLFVRDGNTRAGDGLVKLANEGYADAIPVLRNAGALGSVDPTIYIRQAENTGNTDALSVVLAVAEKNEAVKARVLQMNVSVFIRQLIEGKRDAWLPVHQLAYLGHADAALADKEFNTFQGAPYYVSRLIEKAAAGDKFSATVLGGLDAGAFARMVRDGDLSGLRILNDLVGYGKNPDAFRAIAGLCDSVPAAIALMESYANSSGPYRAQAIKTLQNTDLIWFVSRGADGDTAAISAMGTLAGYQDAAFEKLLSLRSEVKNSQAVAAALRSASLRIIMNINELGDQRQPPNIRFASVANASALKLYLLMVYGEEETHTSSFNGLFDRLIARMSSERMSGSRLLEEANHEQFRTFIKLCANYNRLNSFLSTMGDARVNFIKSFVEKLDDADDMLGEAVVVADIFAAVQDEEILRIMRSAISQEYARVKGRDKDAQNIYGLLGAMFGKTAAVDETWVKEFESAYKINLSTIPHSELVDSQGKHVQLHMFYENGDGDGVSSYEGFRAAFSGGAWKIDEFPTYIRVSSISGTPVRIYANKPNFETEGQEEISKVFQKEGIAPSVVVYRGHSTYVSWAIDQITSAAKVVFLGSCGGYNNIHGVLQKSPGAHVLSTKGTGTMLVNNPLLRIICEHVRRGEDINWRSIRSEAQSALGSNEKFKDYVFPHMNTGLMFLMAYNNLESQQPVAQANLGAMAVPLALRMLARNPVTSRRALVTFGAASSPVQTTSGQAWYARQSQTSSVDSAIELLRQHQEAIRDMVGVIQEETGGAVREYEISGSDPGEYINALEILKKACQSGVKSPEELEEYLLAFHFFANEGQNRMTDQYGGYYNNSAVPVMARIFKEIFSPQMQAAISDDPVGFAARVFTDVVRAQPFHEGNHRAASFLMNFILVQHGLPMFIPTPDNIVEYYQLTNTARLQTGAVGQEEITAFIRADIIRQTLVQGDSRLSSLASSPVTRRAFLGDLAKLSAGVFMAKTSLSALMITPTTSAQDLAKFVAAKTPQERSLYQKISAWTGGFPVHYLYAVEWRESRGAQKAVSGKGAKGVFQITRAYVDQLNKWIAERDALVAAGKPISPHDRPFYMAVQEVKKFIGQGPISFERCASDPVYNRAIGALNLTQNFYKLYRFKLVPKKGGGWQLLPRARGEVPGYPIKRVTLAAYNFGRVGTLLSLLRQHGPDRWLRRLPRETIQYVTEIDKLASAIQGMRVSSPLAGVDQESLRANLLADNINMLPDAGLNLSSSPVQLLSGQIAGVYASDDSRTAILDELKYLVDAVSTDFDPDHFSESMGLIVGRTSGEGADTVYTISRLIPFREFEPGTSAHFLLPAKSRIAEMIDTMLGPGEQVLGFYHNHSHERLLSNQRPGPSGADSMGDDLNIPGYEDRIADNRLGLVIEPAMDRENMSLQDVMNFDPKKSDVMVYAYVSPNRGEDNAVNLIGSSSWQDFSGKLTVSSPVQVLAKAELGTVYLARTSQDLKNLNLRRRSREFYGNDLAREGDIETWEEDVPAGKCEVLFLFDSNNSLRGYADIDLKTMADNNVAYLNYIRTYDGDQVKGRGDLIIGALLEYLQGKQGINYLQFYADPDAAGFYYNALAERADYSTEPGIVPGQINFTVYTDTFGKLTQAEKNKQLEYISSSGWQNFKQSVTGRVGPSYIEEGSSPVRGDFTGSAFSLWRACSEQDPRIPETGLNKLEIIQALERNGFTVISGPESELNSGISDLWRKAEQAFGQESAEGLKTPIKEVIRLLAENVRQHAGNYGVAVASLDVQNKGVYIGVMDLGPGFFQDESGVPVIKHNETDGFVQGPNSPGRGVALGQIYDLADEMVIYTRGYVWKKSDQQVKPAPAAAGIKGTMVLVYLNSSTAVTANSVSGEASSPAVYQPIPRRNSGDASPVNLDQCFGASFKQKLESIAGRIASVDSATRRSGLTELMRIPEGKFEGYDVNTRFAVTSIEDITELYDGSLSDVQEAVAQGIIIPLTPLESGGKIVIPGYPRMFDALKAAGVVSGQESGLWLVPMRYTRTREIQNQLHGRAVNTAPLGDAGFTIKGNGAGNLNNSGIPFDLEKGADRIFGGLRKQAADIAATKARILNDTASRLHQDYPDMVPEGLFFRPLAVVKPLMIIMQTSGDEGFYHALKNANYPELEEGEFLVPVQDVARIRFKTYPVEADSELGQEGSKEAKWNQEMNDMRFFIYRPAAPWRISGEIIQLQKFIADKIGTQDEEVIFTTLVRRYAAIAAIIHRRLNMVSSDPILLRMHDNFATLFVPGNMGYGAFDYEIIKTQEEFIAAAKKARGGEFRREDAMRDFQNLQRVELERALELVNYLGLQILGYYCSGGRTRDQLINEGRELFMEIYNNPVFASDHAQSSSSPAGEKLIGDAFLDFRNLFTPSRIQGFTINGERVINLADRDLQELLKVHSIDLVPESDEGVLTRWTAQELLEQTGRIGMESMIVVSESGKVYFAKLKDSAVSANRERFALKSIAKSWTVNDKGEVTVDNNEPGIQVADNTGNYVVTEYMLDYRDKGQIGVWMLGDQADEIQRKFDLIREYLVKNGQVADDRLSNYLVKVRQSGKVNVIPIDPGIEFGNLTAQSSSPVAGVRPVNRVAELAWSEQREPWSWLPVYSRLSALGAAELGTVSVDSGMAVDVSENLRSGKSYLAVYLSYEGEAGQKFATLPLANYSFSSGQSRMAVNPAASRIIENFLYLNIDNRSSGQLNFTIEVRDQERFASRFTNRPVFRIYEVPVLSSPVSDEKGGIDFRSLPIATQIMPLAQVDAARIASLANSKSLDAEWAKIVSMLQAKIIPSGQRLREYLAGAIYAGDNETEQVDKVLACIAKIMELEEERCQDSSPELKNILVLLESDKTGKDMFSALTGSSVTK